MEKSFLSEDVITNIEFAAAVSSIDPLFTVKESILEFSPKVYVFPVSDKENDIRLSSAVTVLYAKAADGVNNRTAIMINIFFIVVVYVLYYSSP